MISLLIGKTLNEQIIKEENVDDDFTESDNDYWLKFLKYFLF